MRFYRELLLNEDLEKKKNKIVRRLEQGKILLDTYIIILSPNEKNQLEIIDSVLLHQQVEKNKDLLVVGIAKGYQDTLFLIEDLTQKIYDETKAADIRTYILKKQNEGGARCSI